MRNELEDKNNLFIFEMKIIFTNKLSEILTEVN